MTLYLRLSDGSETVTIDNSNYALAAGGWSPAISFNDAPVTETLVINILDGGAGTLAAVRANLEKLQRVLRNVRAFGKGGYRVSACTIEYATDSATSPKPKALLIAAEALVMPSDMNDLFLPGTGASTSIDGVQVTLIRRGTWLGATENSTTSASTANPGVMSATFATSILTPAPLLIVIGGMNGTDTPILYPGLILTANSAAKIGIGPGAAGPAEYTMVADTAAQAVGGTVMRYTPTSTAETYTATLPTTAIPGAASLRTAIWASVRNNGAETYRVRAAITDTETVQRVTEGVLVDASSTEPRWMYLGSITANAYAASFKIAIKASGVTSTLDINRIAMLDMTDEEISRAIAYNQITTHGNTTGITITAGTQADIKLTPYIAITGNANTISLSRLGNANLLSTGNVCAVLWLATYGANWVHINDAVALDPPTATTLVATRYLSTQTPG